MMLGRKSRLMTWVSVQAKFMSLSRQCSMPFLELCRDNEGNVAIYFMSRHTLEM